MAWQESSLTRMPLTIRRATETDVAAITAIYNEAGVGTTASYDLAPVSEADRAEWLAAKRRRQFPVLVAEDEGAVVGFASYGTFRDKAGYDFTVEHSVYVTAQRQSGGVGRMLMTALIDYARGHGVHVMVGAIDAANAGSIRFHEQFGFVESGRLLEVGRKFGLWLDVVLMTLTFEDARPQE